MEQQTFPDMSGTPTKIFDRQLWLYKADCSDGYYQQGGQNGKTTSGKGEIHIIERYKQIS